jgi:hypothetical protein
MRKILYDIKNTSATTNYMTLSNEDMDYLITTLMSIQSYFGELSLCANTDIRDLNKWYTKSIKSLPFHSTWKKSNSPQTFICGTLNNLLYNGQNEISETQSQHLQNIINNFVSIVDVIKSDLKINLQKNNNSLESIMFIENLWITRP